MSCSVPAALVVFLAAFSMGGSSGASTAKASVIPVGVVGSYSGTFASSESSGKPAIQAWADTVNAAGGIDGHKVKLYIEDDDANPATSLTEVETLVQQDHVVAIVGQITTNTDSWAPYIEKQGIPVVGGNTVDLEYV